MALVGADEPDGRAALHGLRQEPIEEVLTGMDLEAMSDAGPAGMLEISREELASVQQAMDRLAERVKRAERFVTKVSIYYGRVDEGSMNGYQFERAIGRLLTDWVEAEE